jgi:hypothetical protein
MRTCSMGADNGRDVVHILHLGLDLDLDRQPITGRLRGHEIPTRSFEGWLELASAVEDARTNASATTALSPRLHPGSTNTP